jgi:hypothetical protein
MRPIAIVLAMSLILIGGTGCSDMKRWEQRALSGGAIGAAAGGGIAYVAGGPVLGAALLGGAAGAAIGGLTTDNAPHRK